jgi:hypothetical protein
MDILKAFHDFKPCFCINGIGLTNLFFKQEIVFNTMTIVVIITILFMGGIAWLVRQGYSWMKFLVLLIMGLLGVPGILISLTVTPIAGIIQA